MSLLVSSSSCPDTPLLRGVIMHAIKGDGGEYACHTETHQVPGTVQLCCQPCILVVSSQARFKPVTGSTACGCCGLQTNPLPQLLMEHLQYLAPNRALTLLSLPGDGYHLWYMYALCAAQRVGAPCAVLMA